MRRILSLLILSLLLIAKAAYATPFCERLKSQPDHWVGRKVDALVATARAAYQKEEADEIYQQVLKGIVNTLRQCKLSEDAGFINRFREFVEYVEAASLDAQPDHELGFTVPDKQYFAETFQYVQVPEFLLAQDFLRDVSRYETLERAKSYLRQLNAKRAPADQLIFFSYKSRHLGTPDSPNSYGRLLIVVPGNAEQRVPEKWVQFGVPDSGARARVRNVSVVSALSDPDGTSSVYFKDFYRTYRRNGSISIKGRWELGEGDDNCVQCHKSGILPIFPVKDSVSPGEAPAVAAVNQRFLTYGAPRFDRYLDETRFGPGLGSAKTLERNQRFGAGFEGTVVAHSMTCAACHQPERLGFLNWPMDRTILSSFIEGGQMPKGSTLNLAERKELYQKLLQEYFAIDENRPGILKSWLLGKLR